MKIIFYIFGFCLIPLALIFAFVRIAWDMSEMLEGKFDDGLIKYWKNHE